MALIDTLSQYPSNPGVYIMKDINKVVLYVGKAKNIKKRVKQYFTLQDTRALIPFLLKDTDTIETIVVNNEKEALLLENNLIKKHKPKYNILLKDDKTYIHLMLTEHKWPMLKLIRFKKAPKKGTFFGPYTNTYAARQVLDLIIKLFPIRQCSDNELANRTRPCILYDIKRCIAPCVNLCTKKEYDDHLKSIQLLLKGKSKEVLDQLQKKMDIASEKLEFEEADRHLQMIKKIKHVLQVQHVDNASVNECDVLNLYREGSDLIITKLVYRQKKLIGSEHFNFANILSEDSEVFQSFLLQHYKKSNLPKLILIPKALSEKKLLEEIFTESLGQKVSILSPIRGEKKKLIDICLKNAKALFTKEKNLQSLEEKRLLDLQEVLSLSHFPQKIECFDTSNLSGSNHVASMVSFINGKKDNSKYRLFNIKSSIYSDDYGAMKEVLIRHYTKQKEKNTLPNLVIIDGGKGHLNLATEVFNGLNIASVDIIAVAKHSSRHDKGLTQEKIFTLHQKEPIIISPTSPLLFLLQNIRDEAHRVAVGFQRKKRGKITSALDDLEGIGPMKKKALLKHFKSIKNLKSTTEDELKEIKELNQKDRETLMRFISSSD